MRIDLSEIPDASSPLSLAEAMSEVFRERLNRWNGRWVARLSGEWLDVDQEFVLRAILDRLNLWANRADVLADRAGGVVNDTRDPAVREHAERACGHADQTLSRLVKSRDKGSLEAIEWHLRLFLLVDADSLEVHERTPMWKPNRSAANTEEASANA